MKFDLAFLLVDLDEPWYKQAACEMIRSARRAYKDHDMRVVQLTDNRSAHCPEADGVFALDTACPGKQLCQFKGHIIAEYALKADRPVIFCDVDILWQNDGLLSHVAPGLVTVMERHDFMPMPYNCGIIVAGGNDQAFWLDYQQTCDQLPDEVCCWWGDQFALVAAVHAHESRVKRVDMDKIAPAVDAVPTRPILATPAVHFKGDRKHLMVKYARMLDGGKGFDFARPIAIETETSRRFAF